MRALETAEQGMEMHELGFPEGWKEHAKIERPLGIIAGIPSFYLSKGGSEFQIFPYFNSSDIRPTTFQISVLPPETSVDEFLDAFDASSSRIVTYWHHDVLKYRW